MLDGKLVVADDLVVSMNYVLSLDDGKEISRADGDDPLEYIQGKGHILPSLEQEVYGMAVGDTKDLSLEPSEGYGDLLQEEVVEVDRDNFPEDFSFSVGKPISVKDRETEENFTAYITEVKSDSVVLDFNHPLAGKKLFFSVEIVDLREASDDEIAHGHVHEDDHTH